MKIDDFRKKAKETLDCACLGSTKDEEEIWKTLELPLVQKCYLSEKTHRLRAYIKAEFGDRHIALSQLTPKHQETYLDVLHQKLLAYRSIVERNHQINSNYRTPLFEQEQAREMVESALRESLSIVRKSYSTLETTLRKAA
ncbi:MAG: hypothetical protein AABY26_00055 [Nanoarchaeota archaeon]